MSVRDLKGGVPRLRARRMMLARVKENFCSISRRGIVCLFWEGKGNGFVW